MSETPPWLSDNAAPAAEAAPAPAPAEASDFSLEQNQTQAEGAAMLQSDNAAAVDDGAAARSAVDEKELSGVILTMRLANMIVSCVLVAAAIVTMLEFPPVSTWVLACYASCFGILVCCLETQLKFLRVIIAVNFGFLFSPLWRFAYYLLMASVAWGFDTLFGKIVSIALGCVALFNTYVLIRYPSYRKVRERIAEEEDKRIEARISREVKRQAVSQIAK